MVSVFTNVPIYNNRVTTNKHNNNMIYDFRMYSKCTLT